MPDFYTPAQRKLQAEFGTEALADRLQATMTDSIGTADAAFVESRNMFFLSTTDEHGFPSSSYKGGPAGFVRVVDGQTLTFPSYDGNGMFMSVGNIEANTKVGLLFIDFEVPRRLRVRGTAKVLREGPVVASYPGATLVVEVAVERVWVNCPRYVHRMTPMEESPYLPAEDGTARLALWKRIDLMQDVLGDADRARAEEAGLITIQEYGQRVAAGEL